MYNTARTYSARILVNGRPITEYGHEGDTYVEGREGSQYEIEFQNHTYQRVLAVVSVDGLSVMDGKRATADSRGYIVEPQKTVRIPGWRLDAEQVAAFKFGSVKGSYNAQSGGDTTNIGVIGVRVYAEKAVSLGQTYFYNNGWPCYGGINGPSWVGGSAGEPDNLYTARGSSAGGEAGRMTKGIATFNATSVAASASGGQAASAAPAPVQQMGTGFGAAQEFNTTTVSFNRGTEMATMLIYYDSVQGLARRGIVTRPARPAKPQAFADGCAPPSGWSR